MIYADIIIDISHEKLERKDPGKGKADDLSECGKERGGKACPNP